MQSSVFLDVLAVFSSSVVAPIARSSPRASAASRCYQRPWNPQAPAPDGVELVDEEDNLAVRHYLFYHALQAVLKYHRGTLRLLPGPDISKLNKLFVAQRNVARNNALCQAFPCGLTNTRFADKTGLFLVRQLRTLNGTANLFDATNNWIEACPGEQDQSRCDHAQGLKLRLCVLKLRVEAAHEKRTKTRCA